MFSYSQGHDLTYSFETTVSNQHTKIADGYFCFSTSTPGSYDVRLTANCDEVTVDHKLTITVEEASEGIAAQYGYDETAKSTVTVYVTLSNDGYPITAVDGTVMANAAVTVPYFDLGLYGLEDYYRYGTTDNQGPYTSDSVVQRPTGLHLYIYLLERYYMGLDESKCCLGTSGVLEYAADTQVYYMDGELAYESEGKRALLTSGGATSIYMVNFWGHDENLMYFRNHCYPLMSAGWGATSDYILLSDGDAWDVGMFSNWSFNRNGKYASFDQNVYTAEPGASVSVSTHSWGTTSAAVAFESMTDLEVSLYNSDWERVEKLSYTSGNTITFTAPETAGTYYLLGLDSTYKDSTNANVAPAAARLVVGGESGTVDISSYYEDYDFISVKDDQDRYLVDIQADSVETEYNGTVPTHQVTIEEGTETVYVTFPAGTAFVEYTGTYSVSAKADSGYGDNVTVTENEDGTVTVGIPVADYTDTDTGVYLENDAYAFVYGFDFTVGQITEVEVSQDAPVSRILLNTYEAALIYNKEESKTTQLTATVLPAEATGWTIEWSSSDETVATVDSSGLVTALAEGEAVITAAIGEIQATCTVTVEKYNSAPAVVSGAAERTKIKVDTTHELDVAALFTDAEGDTLTYTAEVCEASGLTGGWEYTYTAIEGFDTTITDGKFTVSFPEIGIYAVKLTASDGKLSTTHTYQFTVVDNDSGVIQLNDGVTMDIFNVVVVGASEEFVEDYEIPYKGTHDTTIHHIVLSKDTISGGPSRKMDVIITDGYLWGQYSATGRDTYFTTRADIGVFASDPDNNTTAHFLQFHTECQTHTDEDQDAVCDVCTLDLSCETCADSDGDGSCDTCGKQMESASAYGDVNDDGEITMNDYIAVLKYIRGDAALTEQQLLAADVDGDGEVKMSDYVAILQYIRGDITQFPAEQ